MGGIAPVVSLWFLCALGLVAVWYPAAALGQGAEELEREAQAIDRMLMCPVCPAETIDQAQVEISFQMRALVREMLAQGRSRDEVLDYFVDRYGPGILAAPPKSGANLLAWILPVVGVVAGLGAVALVVRAMVGRDAGRGYSGAAPDGDGGLQGDDSEMDPYLEIVDRGLAERRGGRPGRPHPNPPPEGEGIIRGDRAWGDGGDLGDDGADRGLGEGGR